MYLSNPRMSPKWLTDTGWINHKLRIWSLKCSITFLCAGIRCDWCNIDKSPILKVRGFHVCCNTRSEDRKWFYHTLKKLLDISWIDRKFNVAIYCGDKVTFIAEISTVFLFSVTMLKFQGTIFSQTLQLLALIGIFTIKTKYIKTCTELSHPGCLLLQFYALNHVLIIYIGRNNRIGL